MRTDLIIYQKYFYQAFMKIYKINTRETDKDIYS